MKVNNKFSRRVATLTALMVLSLGGLPAYAESQLPPAATVNGTAISSALFEQIINTNVAHGAKDTPEMRQAIKNEMIAREVLAQESVRLGLDKKPQAQEQLAVLHQNLLVELLLKDYAEKNPVSDAAVRTEYDRQVKVLSEQKDLQQYKVGLIVLNSETEARAVLASLHKKGASFENLAREKSIDASKAADGNLGWLLPNQVLPAISTEMVKLTKGALVAAPIQTPTGWNIVKVEDKRPYKIPTLEESKNLVRQGLEQQQRAEYVHKLSEDAKITQ